MTTPKLIKLASGEGLYANQALLDFIKSKVTNTTPTKLVEDDKIFFFKNVSFKRDRLSMASQSFTRVILIEKATAVIVDSTIGLPLKYFVLKGNKIEDIPASEGDDILYPISKFGVEYVDVMIQWFKLSQLTHQPKIIFEKNILEEINSGFVINETNVEYLIDLFKSDAKMAYQLIDSCKIDESLDYILYLVHFYKGLSYRNGELLSQCPLVNSYLHSRSVNGGLNNHFLQRLLDNEWILSKITSLVLQQIDLKLHHVIGNALADNLDLNINIHRIIKQ